MTKKRYSIIALLLAILMVLSSLLIACGNSPDADEKESGAPDTDSGTEAGTETAEEDELDVTDEIPAMNFNEEPFTMLTFLETHADMVHIFDEPSDDPVDLAKYQMAVYLEERFNTDIVEYIEAEDYVNTTYRSMIKAGADDYDLVFAYDRFAHYFAEENVIYNYDDLVYIDLEKDYWDQSLLEYTNVGGNYYYAYGTYDFTYYDLTHCLVFNKEMLKDIGLEDVYELVYDGKWTMDKMYEMCQAATMEINGDGTYGPQDSYGLISSGKQIPPNFWIALF